MALEKKVSFSSREKIENMASITDNSVVFLLKCISQTFDRNTTVWFDHKNTFRSRAVGDKYMKKVIRIEISS